MEEVEGERERESFHLSRVVEQGEKRAGKERGLM